MERTLSDIILLPIPLVILYSYLFFMDNKSNSENFIRSLIIWCIIIFGVWLLYLFVLPHGLPYIKRLIPGLIDNDGGIGTFGDYFGALNTLFAGFAFAGIIISIRQQSADLQDSKKEMRDQTQQFRLNRNIDDIYKRIALIKELENSIELTLFNGEKKEHLSGESALFELSHMIQQLFPALFPDSRDKEAPLYIDNIQRDCLSFTIVFEYLDAWLKSYECLIEDIQDSLPEQDKAKYLRVLINATHGTKLSIIYTFHDTITNYKNFDALFNQVIIKDRYVLTCTTDSIKRKLFIKLLSIILNEYSGAKRPDFSKINDFIVGIANEWREHKGWPALLTISYTPQSTNIPLKGYTQDLEELAMDQHFMQALKNETYITFNPNSSSPTLSPSHMQSSWTGSENMIYPPAQS